MDFYSWICLLLNKIGAGFIGARTACCGKGTAKNHAAIMSRYVVMVIISILAGFVGCFFLQAEALAGPYDQWQRGPEHGTDFFPIGVWLQNPSRADKYKKAGINTYVGLWKGPTEKQLSLLQKAGMKVICRLNKVGKKHINDTTIIGWMHGDEPDNAQSLGKGKGYGPPIPPQQIVTEYRKIRQADPSRPVLLNLGQGVAWDGWHGRGVRTRHPEDYPEYIKGGDIISFDIYPVVHGSSQVAGKLWYVAEGVKRLCKWSAGKKIIWNCIECTHIGNARKKATPAQVRAEVWMSIIHGSRGIIYFVHEWKPRFNEAALLADTEMLAAVTKINKQIQELAAVINAPTSKKQVWAYSDNTKVPLALMFRETEGVMYVFAVTMREGYTRATIVFPDKTLNGKAEVLGENRQIEVKNGILKDSFKAWEVHLYRVGNE